MSNTIIAIDLQTTGPNEWNDEIIDFGAIRVDSDIFGEISSSDTNVKKFDQLADPGRSLPANVTKLTGISRRDLVGKPISKIVLKRFIKFIGNGPIVAHNATLEEKFLDTKTSGRFDVPIIDIIELAKIVLPTLPNYELNTLLWHFNITGEQKRRAFHDARLTAIVWSKLLKEIEKFSPPVIEEIDRLLLSVLHPLRNVVHNVAKTMIAKSFGAERQEIKDIFRDYSDLISRVGEGGKKPNKPPRKLNIAKTCGLFAQGGLLSKTLEQYECRQEQIEMAKKVCEAYNNSTHLMIEAGTGTGKSMAYLVPSIYWAHENKEKVVVSTNTKNLQAQLFFKDIPLLEKSLNIDFKAALIKGRANYLCVRKFLYTLREADRELTDEEKILLLPIITWAEYTDTGDIAENTAFLSSYTVTPYSADLWEKLNTAPDECIGRACRNFKNCFIRKARALSLSADIIIANHSVVFSEMDIESVVLPEYERLIFDEAHNVENVATEYLAVRVNKLRIYRITNRLFRQTKDGTGKGLFANIFHQLNKLEGLRKSSNVEGRVSAIRDKTTKAIDRIPHLISTTESFFNSFAAFFDGRNNETDKVRFQKEGRKRDIWGRINLEKENLIAELGIFAGLFESIVEELDRVKDQMELVREFDRELRVHLENLQTIGTDIEFVLDAKEDNYVYWVERRARRSTQYEICAAPLDIAPTMVEKIYDAKKSVIFSSATLSVGGSFDFMKERLGASNIEDDKLIALDVGSPFDFKRQTLVCVTTFLPDPGNRQSSAKGEFEGQFVKMLVDLLRVTQGRSLVLFTSYAMLNDVYPHVKKELESDGILVLGQGKDGSRSKISDAFKSDISSVLLGTQSFWEGVDIVGESLSCLVVAKLPFHVFTEPIIRARCELIESRGMNSFTNYTVPSAVIRFKQGFGRLIRTRTDRGVVVVADKRIVTKSYGRQFIKSLPTGYKVYSNKDKLLSDVASFLDVAGARKYKDVTGDL